MRRLVFAVCLLVALTATSVAEARTAQEIPYARDRVWNTALRLVRVDLGCPLGERDAETGFFMFEYVDGARRYPGSVELVPTRVENRDGVRVTVQIPAMPAYIERMILDRLSRKLIEDYGQPPRPVRPPPPPREDPPQDGQGDEEHPSAPPGDAPPGREPPREDRGRGPGSP